MPPGSDLPLRRRVAAASCRRQSGSIDLAFHRAGLVKCQRSQIELTFTRRSQLRESDIHSKKPMPYRPGKLLAPKLIMTFTTPRMITIVI